MLPMKSYNHFSKIRSVTHIQDMLFGMPIMCHFMPLRLTMQSAGGSYPRMLRGVAKPTPLAQTCGDLDNFVSITQTFYQRIAHRTIGCVEVATTSFTIMCCNQGRSTFTPGNDGFNGCDSGILGMQSMQVITRD